MAMVVKKTEENNDKKMESKIKVSKEVAKKTPRKPEPKTTNNENNKGTNKDKVVGSQPSKDKDSKNVDKINKEIAVGLTQITQTDSFGKVFNADANPALLSQYIRVYHSNQRQGNAKAKTRGEVSGSGKKPWKQKGTGRSRVGSIRTPVWRHGGVSHGPVPKDWALNLPKKMKSQAFFVALSQKVSKSQVYMVDKIDLQEGRTKELLALTKAWNFKGSVLIVIATANYPLVSASANLQTIKVTTWDNLNAYQLVAHSYVIFEKEALEKVKEKYAKNN